MTSSGEPSSAATSSSVAMSNGMIRFPLGPTFDAWDVDTQAAASAAPLKNVTDFDIPFAPFPRVDRLGRIADWTSPMGEAGSYGGAPSAGGGPSHGRRSSLGGGGTGHYGGHRTSEEGDWSFTTVEQRGVSGVSGGGKRFVGARTVATAAMPPTTGGRQRGSGRPAFPGQRRDYHGHFGHRGYGRFGDRQAAQRKREPSVAISSSWRIMEEIEFSRLTKLQLDPEDPQVLIDCGTAFIYDPAADKINTKNERFLPTEQVLQSSGTALVSDRMLEDDTTLMSLAKKHGASVVASEIAAATLMASSRSVLPWDLLITCRRISTGGRLIIIDKRPESRVGDITVNENAATGTFGSPETADEILAKMSSEATRLRNNLPSLVQKSQLDLETNQESPCGGVREAFRYTKISLTSAEETAEEGTDLSNRTPGDKGENVIIVRSRVRSCSPNHDILPITPLLETQGMGTGMDWRSKLDTQLGAVLAHEIRNNGAQLARSVYEALLSSASHLKLAFIHKAIAAGGAQSRSSIAASSIKFSILGMQEYEPHELAVQMNLNIPNGFGLLRAIVDLIRKQIEENVGGENDSENIDYLLMRDPNKALLRLYKMNVDEVDAAIAELVSPTAELHLSDDNEGDEGTIMEQDEGAEDKDMEQ